MSFDWHGVLVVFLAFLGGIFVGSGSSFRLLKEHNDLDAFRTALMRRRFFLLYLLIPVMLLAVFSISTAN